MQIYCELCAGHLTCYSELCAGHLTCYSELCTGHLTCYSELCAGHRTCAGHNQLQPMRGHNWLIASGQIWGRCSEKNICVNTYNCKKGPERGRDVYFCKWWVFTHCSTVLLPCDSKKFCNCSQSNATLILHYYTTVNYIGRGAIFGEKKTVVDTGHWTSQVPQPTFENVTKIYKRSKSPS